MKNWVEILGAKRRLRILDLLLENDKTITEICRELKMHHSVVNQHLEVLAGANLVEETRHGAIRLFRFKYLDEAAAKLADFVHFFRDSPKEISTGTEQNTGE